MEATLLVTVFYYHMLYAFIQNSSIHSERFFGCLQGSRTLCVYCDNTMRVVSLCDNNFLFQHCNWSEANTYLLGKCMNYKIYLKALHCCHGCCNCCVAQLLLASAFLEN